MIPNVRVATYYRGVRLLYDKQYDDLRALLQDNPFLASEHVNEESAPLIHIAATLGDANVVKLLLDFGADPDMQHNERTPLLAAASEGKPPSPAVAAVLLDAGASPDVKDGSGHTALAWAASHYERPEGFIQELLNRGVQTDLNAAIHLWPVVAVEQFLNEHPDAIQKAPVPNRLLFDAVVAGSPELVSLLLSHGASPNAEFSGESPLERALQMRASDAIVKLLLDAGADPSKTTTLGQSLVELAGFLELPSSTQTLLVQSGRKG